MTPPRKLYRAIADQLTARIADGRYAVGTRLPGERDLAEQFAVSRPTIREAMIALEIGGLVEARHGSGVYVTATSRDAAPAPELDVGAFELMEARILFEGEAAALAASGIGEETLSRLGALVATIADDSDADAAYRADRDFHVGIAVATGNGLIVSTIEMLWTVRETSPLCIHMFAQARREGVTPRRAEHRDIWDALAARDPQRARDAMRAHLRRVVDDMLAATRLELFHRAEAEASVQQQRILLRATV